MMVNTPVAQFSLRGPGAPGRPPVSAPLADPNALAALEHLPAADAAMRHVAHALLVGPDAKQVRCRTACLRSGLPAQPRAARSSPCQGSTRLACNPRASLCALRQHELADSTYAYTGSASKGLLAP